jgi:hypothetical protein
MELEYCQQLGQGKPPKASIAWAGDGELSNTWEQLYGLKRQTVKLDA